MGDRALGELVQRPFGAAEAVGRRYRGQVVKHTGDRVLAVFDGPTRTVRCARTRQVRPQALRIELRTGPPTGACQALKDNVLGSAGYIAARICDRRSKGEVRTPRNVRNLSVGSDLRCSERETVTPKGPDGRWELFSVRPV